jgi:hypothetical protein
MAAQPRVMSVIAAPMTRAERGWPVTGHRSPHDRKKARRPRAPGLAATWSARKVQPVAMARSPKAARSRRPTPRRRRRRSTTICRTQANGGQCPSGYGSAPVASRCPSMKPTTSPPSMATSRSSRAGRPLSTRVAVRPRPTDLRSRPASSRCWASNSVTSTASTVATAPATGTGHDRHPAASRPGQGRGGILGARRSRRRGGRRSARSAPRPVPAACGASPRASDPPSSWHRRCRPTTSARASPATTRWSRWRRPRAARSTHPGSAPDAPHYESRTGGSRGVR